MFVCVYAYLKKLILFSNNIYNKWRTLHSFLSNRKKNIIIQNIYNKQQKRIIDR